MGIYSLLALLLVLMLLRVPIYLALGGVSLIYFTLNGVPLSTLTNRASLALDTIALLAIPLFLLAGKLMNLSGVTKRIFAFCQDAVGFIPGGLGHVNVSASLIFSGMSGAALADIVGLGQVELKAMRDAGYDRDFAIGVTLSSSVLGPIIPPSIAVVLYAINAEVSITGLFLAGFVPGLLMALMLMAFVYVIAWRRGYPRLAFPTAWQLGRDFLAALPAIMTPVILVGGMVLGIFSATEAAAVAVCYSLLLGFSYGEIKPADLPRIAAESAREVALLTIIIAMAMVFGWILVVEQVPQAMAEVVLRFADFRALLLFAILVLLLLLGCFMDATTLLLILPAILTPALAQVGVDPLHFGIIMVIAITIGMYTPPIGIGLFAMQRIANVGFYEVVRAATPWLLPLIAGLVVMTYWPWVVLVLPRAFGY
jgi:tripartite ATP-independent transporter DctM subunit